MQLQEFLDLLGKETGLSPTELEILAGFPPTPIALPSSSDGKLSSLAIVNGDTLLVRKLAGAAEAPIPSYAQTPSADASNGFEVSHSFFAVLYAMSSTHVWDCRRILALAHGTEAHSAASIWSVPEGPSCQKPADNTSSPALAC